MKTSLMSSTKYRFATCVQTLAAVLVATLLTISLSGCDSSANKSESSEVKIQGAGATFPNPIYQKWFAEYNKAHANVKFDYQSIGSGGGIEQISSRTVDFGGSDAPMKDDKLKAAPAPDFYVLSQNARSQ